MSSNTSQPPPVARAPPLAPHCRSLHRIARAPPYHPCTNVRVATPARSCCVHPRGSPRFRTRLLLCKVLTKLLVLARAPSTAVHRAACTFLYHFCTNVRPPVHVTSIRVGRLVWRERGSSFVDLPALPASALFTALLLARAPSPHIAGRRATCPRLPLQFLLNCSRRDPARSSYMYSRTSIRVGASFARRARGPLCKDPPWCLRARPRPILLFTRTRPRPVSRTSTQLLPAIQSYSRTPLILDSRTPLILDSRTPLILALPSDQFGGGDTK
jgi:hypothetical protein